MMRGTNAPIRQARATLFRGEQRDRPHPSLRAPLASVLLSLLVFLAPELTLAPLSAVEPEGAAVPVIDLVDLPLPVPRVQLVDLADPGAATPIPDFRPAIPTVDGADFEAALAAARDEADAYGVTFAVVRDGAILWSGASGIHRDEVSPIAPDDPLVIGSVTKTFIAATILQLAEEGRLRLDDSLRRHVPEMSSISREITIRQLLDHTSGLADVFNETTRTGLEDHPEHAWTTSEVFDALHEPWYEPGENWAYANTNYFLLGMVIERITGTSLADELQHRFLGPMGLRDTRTLTGADDAEDPLTPAWATIFWASGAMSASAPDLARWGDALFGDGVLSDASRESMLDINDHDYGLGLQRIEVPGAVGYGHTGLLNAYTTLLLHLPQQDVTIALLVNRTEVELEAMLAAEPSSGPSLLELLGVEKPPTPTPSPSPVQSP